MSESERMVRKKQEERESKCQRVVQLIFKQLVQDIVLGTEQKYTHQ